MEPWTDPHSIWKTQAAYFSWLRGSLRRIWTRYPVSTNFKNSMCRPNPEPGRVKQIGDCAVCGKTFAKSHLQIDHIIPAGSIRTLEDVGPFLLRLLTTSDNMRLLCQGCHENVTAQERFSLSPEAAAVRLKVVAFTKRPVEEQRAELLRLGYVAGEISNAGKRRAAYQKHLENQS